MRLSKQLRLLQPPASMGILADSVKPSVPIVRARTAIDPNEEEDYHEREKFHPLTKEGQSPNPNMARVPCELSKKINQITLDWSPQQIRQRVAQMYQSLQQGSAHTPAFENLDADAQISGMFLQNYVSLTHALRDVAKRRPNFKPQSILEVGFGPATGILAAREVFGHEIPATQAEGEEKFKETAVIIGHPRMKRRAKEFLGESSKVLFRSEVPSPNSPKKYDLIVATHQLYQQGHLNEELVDSHTQRLAQLLNKNGIAIFVERGDPLGFESVALAREHMLRPKYGFKVVGPCVHNTKCPLQAGLALRTNARNSANENWCRFTQNVERPKFTKELKKGQYLSQKWVENEPFGKGGRSLKGKGRPGANSNEVATFSWVAMENVKSIKEVPAWPRIMKQPLKRHGHVTMEVCAPSGNIEHWTVPRSHGKQAYHDVRKSNAADLWALDAKVKQVRGGLRDPEMGKLARKPAKASASTPDPDRGKLPASEYYPEPCKDWWTPGSNPFFKFSSHQARINSENNVPADEEGFLPSLASLAADENRFDKVMSKELQKRYRK